MAIESTIGGAFTSTYNAVATGFNDDSGFVLSLTTHGEMVDRTDLYGQSLLDWIHAGQSAHIEFKAAVFKAGTKTPFSPWGAFGVIGTTAAPIGRLASAVASAFVMTAVANTPAASLPATLTASKAILPPNSNGSLMYSTKVRYVPIRLAMLPSESAGNITHWTET